MSDDQLDAATLAELLELADEAVAIVLEDRADALAEGREPLTAWDLVGHVPQAMALVEQRLERALRRAGMQGEA